MPVIKGRTYWRRGREFIDEHLRSPSLGFFRPDPVRTKIIPKKKSELVLFPNVRRSSSDPVLGCPSPRLPPLLRPRRRVQTVHRPLPPRARLGQVQEWFRQGRSRWLRMGESPDDLAADPISSPHPPQAFFTFGIQKGFIQLFLSECVQRSCPIIVFMIPIPPRQICTRNRSLSPVLLWLYRPLPTHDMYAFFSSTHLNSHLPIHSPPSGCPACHRRSSEHHPQLLSPKEYCHRQATSVGADRRFQR